ncbi:MAG TPA: ABC transporter ATP-binding protein, partial [Clostridiales bacterium]|nr:ABC transporter ATP-binding protein [Clostridiales bacterium]
MSIMDNILSSGLLVKKNKKEIIANAYNLLEKVNIKKEYAKK